jgi:hypothetical protein
MNLVIPQSNGYDIEFAWNGQEYELVVDMSFWEQPYPIESFIDKIAQQYAGEVIIGESQKIGFQPIKYQQNADGSNTLVLERWNNEKLMNMLNFFKLFNFIIFLKIFWKFKNLSFQNNNILFRKL